jgi:3-hydroxybutyrate dehydrogenase
MEQDCLLPPKEIALAMLALLTDASYKSGTILEVCEVGRWREVALLNDPGPSGPASKTSKKHEALKDILPFLNLEEGDVIRTD